MISNFSFSHYPSKETAYAIKDTPQEICFITLTDGTNPEFFRTVSNLERVQTMVI